MLILLGATLLHFFFVAAFGQLPRFVGLAAGGGLRIFSLEGIAGRERVRMRRTYLVKNLRVPELPAGRRAPFRQFRERHLRAEPAGIFGDAVHGFRRVVANQIKSARPAPGTPQCPCPRRAAQTQNRRRRKRRPAARSAARRGRSQNFSGNRRCAAR